MNLLIDNRTDFILNDEFKNIIEKAVYESLKFENFNQNCEVSVSIVSNEEIKRINKQFRKIDKITDVLSFPQLTFEENEIVDINESGEILLGDIIISIEKAKEQSKEFGHSLQREVAFLIAHSMLHLLGYDHMNKDEENEMFSKQKNILENIGIPR